MMPVPWLLFDDEKNKTWRGREKRREEILDYWKFSWGCQSGPHVFMFSLLGTTNDLLGVRQAPNNSQATVVVVTTVSKRSGTRT